LLILRWHRTHGKTFKKSEIILLRLKVIVLFLLSFALQFSLHAQVCTTLLPSSAIPVPGSVIVTGNNLNHWVCSGGDLNRSGNGGVTVIEDGGVGTLDSDGLEVWILSGAEAVINGTQHTIYVDDGGTVSVNAFQSNIHIVPGATVANNGGLFNTLHTSGRLSSTIHQLQVAVAFRVVRRSI